MRDPQKRSALSDLTKLSNIHTHRTSKFTNTIHHNDAKLSLKSQNFYTIKEDGHNNAHLVHQIPPLAHPQQQSREPRSKLGDTSNNNNNSNNNNGEEEENDDEEEEDEEEDFTDIDQEIAPSHHQIHIQEHEVDESEDIEESDPESDLEDLEPMEPIWNKSIFEELQYIMKKYSRTTLDENDEDTYDATMVCEYAPEIFNYLHELEIRLSPNPRYMNNQDELKWEMRNVLIDWIVQVHGRFNLLPETLFLTVNYIDRFLSKRKVSLSRFQLVGAVALFIAAKYEEINCPSVQEIAYMVDNAYTTDDLLKAERFMIDVLEFDMGWPGPMSFLRRTSKADDYDYETRTLAKYLLEITIMDYRFVASQPSWLASGAHYLSRQLLNKGDWTELHVFYSGYTELQLKPLAEILLENCREAKSNHSSIYEKYLDRRFRRCSGFVQDYFDSIEKL